MGPGIIDESTAQRLLDYRARGGLLSSDELDALISYHCACAVRAERVAIAKAGAWTTSRPTPGKWWVSLHPYKRSRYSRWASVYAIEVIDSAVALMETGNGNSLVTLGCELLKGALWQPRSTPADPFKE